MSPGVVAIIDRLAHPDARVRRIAAMDLMRAPRDEWPVAAAADRLTVETDEATLVTLIRLLERRGDDSCLPQLLGLRDNPRTPARAAHAALLTCDAFELAARRHHTP